MLDAILLHIAFILYGKNVNFLRYCFGSGDLNVSIMICFVPQVQILNKKVDVSKVTSKCGSKDNIKYKPGSTKDNLCFAFLTSKP